MGSEVYVPWPISIMGETNVTLPLRSMRRKAFGANGASVVSVSRTSLRAGRPKASSKPLLADNFKKWRRSISPLRAAGARGLLDRGANTRIGAATADVARHPFVDVGVRGFRTFSQQRRCGHDLSGLTVAALRDIEREPCLLDLLALGSSADPFDGGDALALRQRHCREARSRRVAVDVDRARAAQARAAAEFRAGHVQHIAQNP